MQKMILTNEYIEKYKHMYLPESRAYSMYIIYSNKFLTKYKHVRK